MFATTENAMHASGISITVLSDNRVAYGLEAEHGFSLWIETVGRKILFDTRRDEAMLRNADQLGIELGRADCVVLSHGHYDHTGNVPKMFARAEHAQLFSHPNVLQTRYSIHDAPKQIGMPAKSVGTIMALPNARRNWVTVPRFLGPGVMLTGPVPRVIAYEDTGGPFFLDADGKRPDEITDDQSLWVQTLAGLVVCLGCCHAGVINTLRHITAVAGDKRVMAVIGGMHLLHATETRLEQTAEALKEYNIPYVFPCHCTGDAPMDFLAKKLGASVQPGYVGLKVSF